MGVLRNIIVLAGLVGLILAGQKAWIYYSGPPANSTRTAGDPNETQHQVDRCVNQGNSFTLDDSISGCTAAIQSGRWSGQDLAAVFLNRGKAYANKGDGDRAIADFNDAIRLSPTDAAAFAAIANYNRGSAYQAKGELDRAIADFTEAIRLDPEFADAYNNRGNTYRANGNFDLAIADFDAAIRLNSNDGAAASGAAAANGNGAYSYANRGAAYAAKGDLDRAIADFDDAIRLDPQFAGAYFNRGSAYQVKGDLDRAIADFNEAIRLDPRLTAACYRRGKAYADQGDLDRGLADLKACLQRLEEPGQ